MTETDTKTRARKFPKPSADIGDLKGTVGYMMGKLEGIEDRLDLTEKQQTRMESKIDQIPEVVRDAIGPLAALVAQGFKDRDARIDAQAASIAELEKADAIEKGNIAGITSLRTKLFGGFVAMSGLAATWWGVFHK